MLWLLPYVGWTLAASAVASAAGYAAVTQFSVVQRVLAAALSRALAKLAKSEDGSSSYTVEHTETGAIACAAHQIAFDPHSSELLMLFFTCSHPKIIENIVPSMFTPPIVPLTTQA
jgi:hypothetical protein